MKRIVYLIGDNVFGKVSIQFTTSCKDNTRILDRIKTKLPYDDAVITFNVCGVYVYNLYVKDKVYKLIIEPIDDIEL